MMKYSKYKPSNVEWIGNIPEHWKVGKLYQYCKLLSGSTPLKTNSQYWESGTIKWMSSGEINKKIIKEIDGRITELGHKNSNTPMLPIGTVMMGLNGQGKTKGTVGILEVETTCNQSLCGMIFKDNIIPKFSYYYLESQYYNLRGLVGEGQREGISVSFLGRYPFVISTIQEQQQIVQYLDEKTELIDKLISTKERKIDLLKQQRTSLINEVITKGLNPKVKLKNSGVEWIDDIPEHWGYKSLKYVIRYNEKILTENTDPNYKLNYLEISDVDNNGNINNTTHYLFKDSPSRCRRILSKGDIIISTVRTYLKSIGYIQNEVKDLICSTGFCVLSPTDIILSKYLFYQVLTEYFIGEVISKSVGVSYPSITSTELTNIKVIVPPIKEQEKIVEHLDIRTKEIDDLMLMEQQKINLLKEYRQSLISEVITGKIDVRKNLN